MLPQSVAIDSGGDRLVVRAVADGSTKLFIYDGSANKLQTLDCFAAKDEINPRPNAIVCGDLIRLIEGGRIYEFDLRTKDRSTVAILSEVKPLNCPFLSVQDTLYSAYGLALDGTFGIYSFDTTTKKRSTREPIPGVTAFSNHGGVVFYASEPSKRQVEVHMLGADAKKASLLFSDNGPRCEAMGCSSEYVVACLADASLAIFDRRTGKVMRVARVFRKTPTNCQVEDGMVVVSSLDVAGANNIGILSCKDGSLLGSLSADERGILAMAVDSKRRMVAAVGGTGILRLISY